jgi:hypothetical protein
MSGLINRARSSKFGRHFHRQERGGLSSLIAHVASSGHVATMVTDQNHHLKARQKIEFGMRQHAVFVLAKISGH